jgi:hypothetical protein
MPVLTAGRSKIRQIDFSGGQNSGDNATSVGKNQAELLENSTISRRGKAIQRKGLTRLGDNPDTLISYWSFDASSSVDDKGSNDGTTDTVSYVQGKFGKAASFNGSTSSLTIPSASNIAISSMGASRFSAFIYVSSDGLASQGRIFDKFSSTNIGYRLFVFGQSGGTVKLDFEVGHATTNTRVITSTTIPIEEWHKIDAIYNTDKSGDIYIDGVLATYSTDTIGVGAISNDLGTDLCIGNDSTSAYTFDGHIDDASIYDGTFTIEDVEQETIRGLSRFTVGSTIDTIVRVKDTSAQRLSSDYKTWTDITGLTTLTADTTTNFVQANNKLFLLNGVDNVFSMDSALAVTDEGNTNTDPPRSSIGEWTTINRLFLMSGDDVYFSDSLDPQTFDRTLNKFSVRSGSGGTGTWLKAFKQFELIVYKNDSIFVLDFNGPTPLTDWNVTSLSVAVGCPAGRTVQDIGNDHIFLANDGVRLLSRTSFDKIRVGVISTPIQDIMDDINQDAIGNSVGWFENGIYLLGVPTGTNTLPNRFMIWDSFAASQNQDPSTAWTTIPEDVWNLSCLASFNFGDNLKTIVGGDARALSLCYKVLSGNTDNGNTIVQKIITRQQDFDDPVTQKIFDPVQVVCVPGEDAVYQCSIDVDRTEFKQFGTLSSDGLLQTPFTTPATTIAGGENETNGFRTKFAGRGNSCRLQFVNQVYNTSPEFSEYTIHALPYNGRI